MVSKRLYRNVTKLIFETEPLSHTVPDRNGVKQTLQPERFENDSYTVRDENGCMNTIFGTFSSRDLQLTVTITAFRVIFVAFFEKSEV